MSGFSFSKGLSQQLKEYEVTNTSDDLFKDKGVEKVEIVKKEDMFLEFDLIGYDTSVANAVRRILLSDVPTMAIEKVHIYQNTSIMQDEVLAHRMGLIPLKANPTLFKWKEQDAEDEGTEEDTLQFSLQIKCKSNENGIKSEPYINHHVYTKHIKWLPQGSQATKISDAGPVETDILINKLRPGHEMDLKLFAVKGVGRDHAKFCPVATAFYRLHPEIIMNRDVFDNDAVRLQKCFSPGVIILSPTDDGRKKAEVQNARYDSCSRNVYRYNDLKDAVTLQKRKNHFIFNVESTGALAPTDLVPMALDILIQKCDIFIKQIDAEHKN